MTVAATVSALVGVDGVGRVVVVDDGSGDDTAERASQAGAEVVRLATNVGKGGAVAAGVASAPGADVYLFVDADVGDTAAAVSALLAPVAAGEADMAIGVLPAARGGGFGLVRWVAGRGIRRACGFEAAAPLSGQRAVRAELLDRLALAPAWGLEVGLTIDAVAAGARVVEVPVAMDHRRTGRSPAGFAHRAAQGAGVVRALWPRLTTSRARSGVITGALVVALVGALWSGTRWPPRATGAAGGPASRVLILGLPGLAWEDVGTGRMPALDALAGRGAVGAMSVRTLSDRPSRAEGYATLGAGSRVAVPPGAGAAVALGGQGAIEVGGAAGLRSGAGSRLATRPGDLGHALAAAGRRTAVVGNADTASGLSDLDGVEPVSRPAALALMDRAGLVDLGTVEAADLLVADPVEPFGRRSDPARVAEAALGALGRADVVLVDPGDLDRAAALTALGAPPEFVAAARDRALVAGDRLLAQLAGAAPAGTMVMVLSVVPPAQEWRLAPVIAAGPGVGPGELFSQSTRRKGLVTLTDVAPTILEALGVPVPPAMAGHPFRWALSKDGPTAAPRARPGRLAQLDRDGAGRERSATGLALALGVLQVVTYVGVAAAATAGRGPRRPPSPHRALNLAVLSVAAAPLASYLLRALAVSPSTPAGALALAGLDAGAAVLAWRLGRPGRHPLGPMALVLGTTTAILLWDVSTGSRLQFAGLLGYSPQTAGRFYGLGNTSFAVLATSCLLAAGLHIHHAPRPREAWQATACLLALVVVVDGAPSLGADVGGLLALPPVFLLALMVWRRDGSRRDSPTWRRAWWAVGAGGVALAAATAWDLSRPVELRTHLGRLAGAVGREGPGELWAAAARKVAASLDVLGAIPVLWVAPLAVGALTVWLVRRRGGTGVLLARTPVRTGVLAALAATVAGALVNDSGAVVMAFGLVEVGPVVAAAALSRASAVRAAAPREGGC